MRYRLFLGTEKPQTEPPSDTSSKKGPEKFPKPVLEKPAKPVLERPSRSVPRPSPADSLSKQESEKPNKSPPPPPPRKIFPGSASGMTTTRSGEVVYINRKESVSSQVGHLSEGFLSIFHICDRGENASPLINPNRKVTTMPHPPLPKRSPPRFRQRPSRSRPPLPPWCPQPLEKRRMTGTRSWRSSRLDKHRHTYTRSPQRSNFVTLSMWSPPCQPASPPLDPMSRSLSVRQRRKTIEPPLASKSFSAFRPSPSLRSSGVPEVRGEGGGARKLSRTHPSR